MKDQLIQTIKNLLSEVSDLAKSQVKDFKKKNNTPVISSLLMPNHLNIGGIWIPRDQAEINLITDPATILCNFIETFWDMYGQALEIIDKPAVQYMMRPLMEMLFVRIIYFSLTPVEEQKQIVVKLWLLTTGLRLQPENTEDKTKILKSFDLFTSLLSDSKEKKFYQDLIIKQFPFKELHAKLHKLLPSILDDIVLEIVATTFSKQWKGKTHDKVNLDKIIRSMSLSVHANPFHVRELELRKAQNKDFIRYSTLMNFLGLNLIRFCDLSLNWTSSVNEKLDSLKISFELEIKKLIELGV